MSALKNFRIPFCSLINNYLVDLARKFPATKFLKSISTTCVPNYPDKNLPTIFVYFEGNLKKQLIGSFDLRGMNLTCDGECINFDNQMSKYFKFTLYFRIRMDIIAVRSCSIRARRRPQAKGERCSVLKA